MNIGEAAAESGISAKMIRYYESMGLMPSAARSGGNYRVYEAADVHALRFIRRARDLGFSMQATQELLRLWRDSGRASSEVRAVATKHVADLEEKIANLQAMAATLRHLVAACAGDSRPHCPILIDLAGDAVNGHTRVSTNIHRRQVRT